VAALAIFVAILVVLWEGALLAVTRSTASASAIAAAAAAAFATALTVAAGIQGAAAVAGPWWWPGAGALAAGVLVTLMHAAPPWLARSSGARPVTRPALVERLGALSRQIHVPIESIDELPAGAAATSTALVAGAGGARRVFIAHDLIRDWTDDEVAVVVAHEFAHHAHHDLWRTLVLDAGILALGFWMADALARLGRPVGLPAVGTLGALPFIALVVGAVWVAAAPVRHAASRRQERRADDFALRATGSAEAFRTALRRLASKHLAEERPSRLVQLLYHGHPSVTERLAAADTYETRTVYRPIDPSIHRSI
jgi:STE24 endopeptidase